MTQLVLTLSRTSTADAKNSQVASSAVTTHTDASTKPYTKEIILLGALLASLQVMDGILTYLGVMHFGLGAEANAFVRYVMHQMGPQTALILLKSIALIVVVVLCNLARSVSWLRLAMKTIIAVYIVAAIVPWSTILLMRS